MDAVNSASYAAVAHQLPPLVPPLLSNFSQDLRQKEVKERGEENCQGASEEGREPNSKRRSELSFAHDEVHAEVSFSGPEDLFTVNIPDWGCSAQISRTQGGQFTSGDRVAQISKESKEVIKSYDFPFHTTYFGRKCSSHPQLDYSNIFSPIVQVIHKDFANILEWDPPTSELTLHAEPFTPLCASDYPAYYLQYSGQAGGSDDSRKRKVPEGEDFPQRGGGYQGRDNGHGENGSGGDGGREGKPKKKRIGKKAEVACAFCRKERKLKCSGDRPTCLNCKSRRLICEYPAGPRRRGPGKKTRAQREQARVGASHETPVTSTPQASTSTFPSHGEYVPFGPTTSLPGPPIPQYPYQPSRAPNIMPNIMIGPGMGLQHQIQREGHTRLPPIHLQERGTSSRISIEQLGNELRYPQTSQHPLHFQPSREETSSRELTASGYSSRYYRDYSAPDPPQRGAEGGAEEETPDPYIRRRSRNPPGEDSTAD